jgi:hypothetical protein
MMPLVRGELVGLIWVRPLEVGRHALAAIGELRNIAATYGAERFDPRPLRVKSTTRPDK